MPGWKQALLLWDQGSVLPFTHLSADAPWSDLYIPLPDPGGPGGLRELVRFFLFVRGDYCLPAHWCPCQWQRCDLDVLLTWGCQLRANACNRRRARLMLQVLRDCHLPAAPEALVNIAGSLTLLSIGMCEGYAEQQGEQKRGRRRAAAHEWTGAGVPWRFAMCGMLRLGHPALLACPLWFVRPHLPHFLSTHPQRGCPVWPTGCSASPASAGWS